MTTNAQTANKKKSPLDVLEDILEDSKKNAGVGQVGQTNVPDPNAKQLTEEQQLADIKKQQAQQVEADQVNIQQKLQEIASLKNSPQVKAAENQDKAELKEQKEHSHFMQGNEIVQLQHKKIEVTD